VLNTGLLTLPASHGDVETEALNTDVMRFLAIIALCLLAVFAAVSSEMPQSAREMIEVQANMIQVQQAETSQLQTDQSNLQAQLRKQTQRVELLTTQLQQSQQEQSQQEHAQREQEQQQAQDSNTDIFEEQLRVMQIESNALAEALNQSDSDLARVTSELQRETETSARLLETVAMLQRQLNQRSLDLQQPETELQQQIARQQFQEQQEQQDETAVEFPADPVAERTPLTLSFASINALMNLVDNGRVQLMAIALPNMWSYDPQTEDFLPLKGDEFLYEINKVPGSVKAQAAATTGESNLDWGVVMDAGIRAELELMISNNDSGGIIVNADGSLSHRP